MPIADKIRKSIAEGSWIRRMFEEGTALKRRYGQENVFDLSLGNPVMEPPPEFDRELRRLAEHPLSGMHRYMENAGYPETRAAVADFFKADRNFSAVLVAHDCELRAACERVFSLDPGGTLRAVS